MSLGNWDRAREGDEDGEGAGEGEDDFGPLGGEMYGENDDLGVWVDEGLEGGEVADGSESAGGDGSPLENPLDNPLDATLDEAAQFKELAVAIQRKIKARADAIGKGLK